MVDWSQLYQHRKRVAKEFGELWALPLAKRYHAVLADLGDASTRVLEIGAGGRGLKKRLDSMWGSCDYKSCDIDPTFDHDFNHVDQVTGQYDLICLFEIIEHISIDDAGKMLETCLSLLKPGGHIVISTPNIFYPQGYLRDVTHCSAWCYDELGGFLELTGFKTTAIYRIHNDSVVKKLLRRVIFYPWFRIMNIDFARQIVVVGSRPSQ